MKAKVDFDAKAEQEKRVGKFKKLIKETSLWRDQLEQAEKQITSIKTTSRNLRNASRSATKDQKKFRNVQFKLKVQS